MPKDNIHQLNAGNRNGGQKSVEVSIDEFTVQPCECGNTVFQQGYQIATLSKVHPKNPTGKTNMTRIPVNICMACGEVKPNQDFTE